MLLKLFMSHDTRPNQKFALIDGNALLHRAFHAYPKTLTTKEGLPVNAVYGFSRLVLTLLKDLKPKYIAVAFDTKAPTFRHIKYNKYKSTRPAMENDLIEQLDLLQSLVDAFHIKKFSLDGYEADDLIGTIAAHIDNEDLPIDTYIITGDMDTLQLVDENTFIYAPQRGLSEPKVWKIDDIEKKYFFSDPKRIIDYKALRGDPSDNIPGVPGIGHVTAVNLLRKFKSIKKLYSNLDLVSPESVKKKLEQSRELALLSQELATIKLDVPLTWDLNECCASNLSENTDLITFFEEMQFNSLLKELLGNKSTPVNENQLSLL